MNTCILVLVAKDGVDIEIAPHKVLVYVGGLSMKQHLQPFWLKFKHQQLLTLPENPPLVAWPSIGRITL